MPGALTPLPALTSWRLDLTVLWNGDSEAGLLGQLTALIKERNLDLATLREMLGGAD